MKTLGFVASSCLLLGLAGSAEAEIYTAKHDPSGAPMCFDNQGGKAPLAVCNNSRSETYVTRHDPTGVAMCLTSRGEKAALLKCETQRTVAVAPATDKRVGSFLAVLSFFR